MKDRYGTHPTHKVPPDVLASRFENRTFSAVDPAVGDLDYYIYDPIEHGASADRKYPLILFFHGSQMNLVPGMVPNATDMAIFASEEYQSLLHGAYIVLPRANEKREENGMVSGSWGFWNGRDPAGQSPYLKTLHDLVRFLIATHPIDAKSVAVGGVSAGGLMCWQFAIANPELCAAAFPLAPIYVPSPQELDMLEQKAVPIWLVHGKRDELANFDMLTGSILNELKKHPNIRISAPEHICFGDKTIVSMNIGFGEMGQHQAQYAIGQNMLYDDGSPYDEKYPEGFIAWLNRCFVR